MPRYAARREVGAGSRKVDVFGLVRSWHHEALSLAYANANDRWRCSAEVIRGQEVEADSVQNAPRA